jgi:DNA-directed RNA polymerase specialized sigma24 family protein
MRFGVAVVSEGVTPMTIPASDGTTSPAPGGRDRTAPADAVADVGDFDGLLRSIQRPLQRSLIAHYGAERGGEAYAEAIAYAWEHRERVGGLSNPVAYLFKVGQSRTRLRKVGRLARPTLAVEAPPPVEPGLAAALEALSRRQRTCVVLCVGYEWSQSEVAELLGISKASVQKHVERALASIRTSIGEVVL